MAKDNSIMEKCRKIGFTVMIFLFICLLWGAIPVKAAEEENITACKQELLEMMRNMDSSWHDIAAWKLTVNEVNNAWWELIEEEGYVEYHSYNMIYVSYKISNGYALSMSIVGLDNLYPQRYASIQKHINIVKEATKDMTDLEKVLFVNEYIDDITYYYDSDVSFGRACGPLYYGYGVCADYAEGARMLLRQIGIPVAFTSSSSINHAWNYVNIDGEWYHMDCTWDDAKGQGGTDTKHTYFIRNDKEYTSTLPKKHDNWIVDGMKGTTSTSTIYENWFVHDIKGKMHYYDGLWYYIDNKTGNIVCSKVDVEQSQYEVLVNKTASGISKLAISKVEGNTLYYTADGVACELPLKKNGNSSSGEVEGLDWSDASCWRTGHYNLKTGVYQPYPGRICLKDYVEVNPGKSYQAQISNNEYRILIRELDENKNYITGWNLCNGRVFSTSDHTKYLAVSIYSESKTPAYQEYCKLFEQGMTVSLTQDVQPIDVRNMTEWNNEKYWRTGCYLLHTGKYGIYHSRICLLDYIPIEAGAEYKVKLTNEKYHMLIREMTQDMKYITSHDLQNGDIVKLTEDAVYAAISIYYPNNDYYMDYTRYLSELMNGMEIGLSKIDKEEESEYENSLLWNQTNDWRTGHFSMTTGEYQASYKSRVCLQDYVPIDEDKAYQVLLTDDKYHMLIREMTSDKSFITSHNLAGGDYFIPSDHTAYLAISLYMPDNDRNAVFDDYVSVIQAGVGLQEVDATEAVCTLALEDEEMILEETEEITEEETTEEESTEESTEMETEEESTEESTEVETEENRMEESTEAETEENRTEESMEAETEENSTEESQEDAIERSMEDRQEEDEVEERESVEEDQSIGQ